MEDELIRAFRHTFGHRAALHVENGETAHRVRRHKRPFRSTGSHYDYSFPAYRNVNHEMQRRVSAHLTSAKLAGLSLSGLDIGEFASDRTGYRATAEAGVGSTTVTAIPADGRAGVAIADADGSTAGRERTVSLSTGANRITVAVTAPDGATMTYTVDVKVLRASGSDRDEDGLIEVASLVQLDAIRHDLDADGTPSEAGAAAYAAAFPGSTEDTWCPTGCSGYELAANLNFDTNGNGIADSGDSFWNGGAGWVPIGRTDGRLPGARRPFRGTFDGNGHRIENLFIHAPEAPDAGLFGASYGTIRRVAVVDADVTGKVVVGALVGLQRGLVESCYTSGSVTGSHAGGLSGVSFNGKVRTSFSTARVAGGVAAGGLVGNDKGRILTSYATGLVSGADDGMAGGISGNGEGNRGLENSYATGAVAGGARTGGLAGVARTVIASYWDADTSGIGGSGGRSTSALQSPTGYDGIYQDWNSDVDGDDEADDPWHFGRDDQYPALSVDFDGDGVASWGEFGYQLRGGPVLTAAPGAGKVALAWTAADAGFRDLRGDLSYTVWRQSGGTLGIVAEGLTSLEYADVEVDAGATYRYQVAAVVEGGEGARSGWAEARAEAGPTTVTITADTVSATEGSPVSFTVTRTGPAAAALVVNVAVSETGTMLSSPPGSLTLGEGERSGMLTLATADDAVVEVDSTVTAEVAAGDGYALGDPASAELTVADNDAAAPVVTGSTAFTVTEGDTAVGTLTATDEDTAAGDLEWTITGGADRSRFGLTTAGALSFGSGKDYENPDDTGTDGTYEVAVQVGDGTNATAAEVTVTLANRNEAPTAEAGSDQGDVAGGTTVTLSGSGADPDDGDSLSYAWSQTAGTTVTLATPSAASTTFTAPPGLAADETLTFKLTVTDGGGLTGEDTVTVTVLAAPPAAPVVTGSTAFTVTEGDTAVGTLTATDEDTTAGDLEWTITGGADRSRFGLTTAGALSFGSGKDYENPDDSGTDGTYEVAVQVSDGTNATAAEVTVTLANRNEAPTAEAGSDQGDVAGGTTVTLSGTGADPDDGDSLSYAWSQTAGTTVTLGSASSAETTFTAPSGLAADETLTFKLTVTDGGGLTGEDTVTVTVLAAPPAAPVVTGSTAFTVTEGDTAVGTLTATDEDTAAGDLEWTISGGADRSRFGLTTAGALSFGSGKDYENPDDTGTDGTYEVAVQVSDGTNATAAEVTVTLANRNEAPTAEAGSDQGDVAGGTTVTLSGTGTDPDDGDSLSYAWSQTAGTTVTLGSASSAETTFTAPSGLAADETLTFKLTVTDGGDLTGEDTVTVTVTRAAAPVVTGSTAFTVTEGETAVGTLTATDEDTAAGDLEWTITGGADRSRFGLTTAGVLSFGSGKDYENPDDSGTDGTYEVAVQVSDGTNAAAAEVTVTLANRNEAPTAEAGSDQADIAGGATVTLSGTGADPDDGDSLSYAWSQTAGTTVMLATPSAASTTLTAPSGLSADEILTFKLTVTDGGGLTGEDTVTVTVLAAPPAAPVVTGSTSFTVTEGDTAVGTLTATDEDTAAGDLEWTITGGADRSRFGLTTAGVLSFGSGKDYENPDDTGTDGTYEVAVQVSDGTNATAAEVTVTLANRNEAPTAEAGSDQGDVAGGTTVTLSGTGTDPDDGDSLSYAWSQTAGTTVTLGSASSAETTFTAPSGLAADETLTFKLTVTDGGDLTGEDTVTVTVTRAAAPVVTGSTAFTVTEGETAVGTLTATDEDTAAGDLEWTITGGADRSRFGLTTAGALSFGSGKDYENPDDSGTDGTYEVAVQVGDGTNATAAEVTVTLANRNEAPTAEAGSDQADIAGGATVTLSGTGADPDDGDSLSYAWSQTAGTTVTLATPSAASTTFTAPSGLAADETLTFRLRVTDGDGLSAQDETSVTVLPPPDQDGTWEGARELDADAAARSTQHAAVRDRLDTAAGDRVDYYVFTILSPKELGLGVRDQSINLDVTLEDSAGRIIKESWPPPVDPSVEWLLATLDAGTYYIRVEAAEEGATRYRIRFGLKDPVAISVADARAQEGAGATLDFEVSLDRGPGRLVPISVNYTTVNGTAAAGSDYTATSGTLTFEHGEMAKTVSVPVLEDSNNEDEETLVLRLSSAAEARISDGEATGTITDSD